MTCEWCGSEAIASAEMNVYWELPDGTRAIEITGAPSVECASCQMKYQEAHVVKEIENQLFLIRTANLEDCISYVQLMAEPRILKKNYFDFS
ncbi:YokU family protein [Bacillus sp. FJAT-42376]|uniref:YokU family protein n=1 Tax=Bacillus sp. FJAT-42376 TaxID=2014076 RepID=UPI000F4FA96E|nr:YokU family protein [Bacillus sp. FJAT-42376]AZB43212.1 YokU family protein [Bacillus sp. FJAT-42376]